MYICVKFASDDAMIGLFQRVGSEGMILGFRQLCATIIPVAPVYVECMRRATRLSLTAERSLVTDDSSSALMPSSGPTMLSQAQEWMARSALGELKPALARVRIGSVVVTNGVAHGRMRNF